MPERLTIAGIPVDPVTMQEAMDRASVMFHDGRQHLIVTPNPEMAVLADRDPSFKKILEKANLALPDGFGLSLAAKYEGKALPTTVHGVDFAFKLAALAEQEKYSVYLLGGLGSVTSKAARMLKAAYPDLRIVGAESDVPIRWIAGAWEEDPTLTPRIAASKPDLLFVALGHGKQERWIRDHLPHLPTVKIAIGIGGAFDYWSGAVRRAPGFMRTLHLEWLWRVLIQPWRLPRIFDALVRFARVALKYRKKRV